MIFIFTFMFIPPLRSYQKDLPSYQQYSSGYYLQPQYGITDMLLFFNDPVELLVNRPTAEQVVAIH